MKARRLACCLKKVKSGGRGKTNPLVQGPGAGFKGENEGSQKDEALAL